MKPGAQSLNVDLLLRAAIALCAVALMVPAIVRAGESVRPNVLFILADDLGYGDLSRSGHPRHRTPAIDRIAAEGMEFRQFNVVNPVCSPSRAAAMTGQFPARLGIHQHFSFVGTHRKNGMPDWLDPQVPNVARILQGAGYATGHFGKWHLTNNTITDAPLPAAYGFSESRIWNGPGPRSHPHQVAEHTVDFIRRNAGRPWFVNLWLHEPHTPHHPTEESLRMFAHLDEQRRVYAAVLADADRAVGRVLGALQELGLDEQTLVVFWSDNGPENTGGPAAREMEGDNFGRGFGSYFSVGVTGGLRGRKRNLFEGGVRVPFFVRWPGRVPAGKVDDTTPIAAVDLLPTVCAAAGVAPPAASSLDGENMLPAWLGTSRPRTKPIYWEWRGGGGLPDGWPRLAVRDGKWKLALNANGSKAELYDVVADRAETKDLAATNPEIVARLRKDVLAWQASLPANPPAHCLSSLRGPTPAKSSAALTGFSWERVPLYLHFGKRSAPMTEAELDFVAKHTGFVALEKGHGAAAFGSTEEGIYHTARELKRRNPSIKVLFHLNAFINWQPYDAFKSYQPEWTLRDATGKVVTHPSGTPRPDPSIPAMREWWSDTVAEAMRRAPLDGVFADAFPQAISPGLARQVGAEKAKAIVAGLREMIRLTKAKIGPARIVLANGTRTHDFREILDWEGLDGVMIEHFGAFNTQKPEDIRADLETLRLADEKGKFVVLKGWPGFNWLDKEMMAKPRDELRRLARANIEFPLACFLVAARPGSFFCYSWGYVHDHGMLDAYPEFERRLGLPRGDAVWQGSSARREFEHASVWVDLAARQARIEWRAR